MMNWEINVGHLLTMATVIFVGGGFYWSTLANARTFRTDIKEIKLDLKSLNELMSNQKLIEHRLLQLEKWWDEMRRGRGFIREEINGEWTGKGHRPE